MEQVNIIPFKEIVKKKLELIKSLDVCPIIVLAPIFDSENITDGYFQRISTIDETVLTKYFKIYLHLQEDYTAEPLITDFYMHEIDECHIEIGLNPHVEIAKTILSDIISICKITYIHTALRVIKRCTGAEIRELISNNNMKIIWDVHGSVPEEFALHDDFWGSQEASEAEAYLADISDVIIVVTKAMKNHLKKKYFSKIQGKIVVLPIFNNYSYNIESLENDKLQERDGLPRIVYAGGIQKWQKIDEMQEAIYDAKNYGKYYICIPHRQNFIDLWKEKQLGDTDFMEIKEMLPQDLYELYRTCHYGFALRDELVVNYVACPTKIIEYLQFGIIPILKSKDIGDFINYGMKYIPVEDLKKGKLPSSKTRNLIARKNFKVLKRMNKQNMKGKIQLTRYLEKKLKYHVPVLRKKHAIGILLEDIHNEDYMKKILELYKRLSPKCYVYIITNSFDIKNLVKEIPIEHIYSYSGLKIKDMVYGGNASELRDFCNRNNIKYMICGNKKICINSGEDMRMFFHYIGF